MKKLFLTTCLACGLLLACKEGDKETNSYDKKQSRFDDANIYLRQFGTSVCKLGEKLDSIADNIKAEAYPMRDDTAKSNAYIRREKRGRFVAYLKKIGVKDTILPYLEAEGKDKCTEIVALEKYEKTQRNASISQAVNMMSVAFEGSPSESEIEPLIEKVIELWGLERTNERATGIGSALVAMRKASKKGVTEMEILRYTIKLASTKMKLPDAIGMAATILETSK